MTSFPSGRAPRVERIELFALRVPFRAAVQEAMRRSPSGLGMAIPAEEAWTGGDFVIARLTAEGGAQGVGEAFVWLPETGVSPAQVIAAVRDGLARYLLGASPFDVEPLRARYDANVARSEVAKGLLDMACYDLMAGGRRACPTTHRPSPLSPLGALQPQHCRQPIVTGSFHSRLPFAGLHHWRWRDYQASPPDVSPATQVARPASEPHSTALR